VESFNGRLRDECLNVEWFSSLDDAGAKLARFREHYNRERPHSALADRTPAAFAELHRSKEKSSTLMGRENRVNSGRKDVHCPKPLTSFVTENGSGSEERCRILT
jgi:putative transposase